MESQTLIFEEVFDVRRWFYNQDLRRVGRARGQRLPLLNGVLAMNDKSTACHNFGDAPGCLGTPDDRYTMRWDDLGEPPMQFCAVCGPEAHAMAAALELALATRGPEFAKKVDEAIKEAEASRTLS